MLLWRLRRLARRSPGRCSGQCREGGVERVAQAVTDEVDRDDVGGEEDAGEDGEPPGEGDVVLSAAEQDAPLGTRRGHPHPEEAEGRDPQGREPGPGRGHHQDPRAHVGQHVGPRDPCPARTEGDRGVDVRALADLHRRSLDHAGVGRDRHQRDGEDAVAQAGAEHRARRESEQDPREGQEQVHDPHQDESHGTAVQAGDDAHRRADDPTQDHDHHAGGNGRATAVRHSGQEVAAEGVGAERMLARRSEEGGRGVAPLRVREPEERGEQDKQHDAQEQEQPERQAAVRDQGTQALRPVGRHRPRCVRGRRLALHR